MRIISWNCNGAFRKKVDIISKYDADIYVIQECEDPIKTNDKSYKAWSENYLWIGDNKNKGLGVFAKNGTTIEKLEWSNIYEDHDVKYFLPSLINSSQKLLGVWTHRNNSPNFGYIGQFWKYLRINKSLLKDTIVIGDLNSNKRWDEWDIWWNHSDVVKELKEIGLASLYHSYYNEQQGEEKQASYYMHKNQEKPYHIDYCFAPIAFTKSNFNITIGDYKDWIGFSDHMPLIADVEI